MQGEGFGGEECRNAVREAERRRMHAGARNQVRLIRIRS